MNQEDLIVLESMNAAYEFIATEATFETFKKDMKKGEPLNISSLKSVSIGKKELTDPALKRLRTGENCNGEAFYEGKELVCFYMTEKKDDGSIWIQGLEVMPKYRGRSLSGQLLNRAISKFKAKRLAVNKKNEVAYRIYLKKGFKVFKETPYMYFMELK